MQIVKLMGGFANQLREYVYGKYLQYCTGETIYYDDSWFFLGKAHNGYELQRVFGLNLHLISKYFQTTMFSKILKERKPVYQVLYDIGVDIDLVLAYAGEDVPFTGHTICFDKQTAFASVSNSRYHWTYAGEYADYYAQIKDVLDRELIFPPFPDKKSRSLAEEIGDSDSVGIHIRRGDFAEMGWLGSPEYYRKCIEYAERELHPDGYYVFSDDVEYCRKHIDEYGFGLIKDKLIFVVGNRGLHDYIDFRLMTFCKHFIVAPRSSFSSCACVFNKGLRTKINWETVGMEFEDSFGRQKSE